MHKLHFRIDVHLKNAIVNVALTDVSSNWSFDGARTTTHPCFRRFNSLVSLYKYNEINESSYRVEEMENNSK